MDNFVKTRLGILILALIGLFAIPFGTLLVNLKITGDWLVFILGAYGTVALFCEEVVRHYFKIPKGSDPPA